jgi:hypothetical protein
MNASILTANETLTRSEAQRKEILSRLTRFRRRPDQAPAG